MASSAFSLLGLTPSYDLDLHGLERRHRELAAELHPDRVGAATSADRVARAQRLAEVNAAFAALKAPVSRAEALMRELGVAVGDGHEPAPAADLLMQVLEAREELSDARRAKDMAACERHVRDAKAALAAASSGFRDALARQDIAAAVRALGEMRYHARWEKDARDSLALLEDEGL